MRDFAANDAVATLARPIGATDTLLFLAPGSTLPQANTPILVIIDQEILRVLPTSPAQCVVLIRGAEGTAPSAHLADALAVQTITAGMITHLWRVVADTFQAAVPPSAPSPFDHEFETENTAWSFTPRDGLTVADTNTTLRSWWYCVSHALGTPYTYLRSFIPAQVPWRVSARLSVAQDLRAAPGLPLWSGQLLVADDAGRQMQIGPAFDPSVFAADVVPAITVRAETTMTSAARVVTIPRFQTMTHFSLVYDGATISAAVGDGLTWTTILTDAILGWTPTTLGFLLRPNAPEGVIFTAAADWLRVTYA